MIIVTLLAGLLAAVLLLPVISDLVSLARLAAGFRPRPSTPRPIGQLPRLLFLVPAHDEERMIESCVRSLLDLRYPAECFDVLVVADNCTDRTADLARAAGARCLERRDPASPGKPRALAWALTHVRLDELDAVIIIDADTVVDPGFGVALAGIGSPIADRIFQAYNDVRNPGDTLLTRMATVLAAANYRFAYALKRKAGLNAPLSCGMCLGAKVLVAHGWRAFTIAEDVELYARYTAQGVSIESLPEAHLYAQEAASLEQSSTQRLRWTAGKLTVLVSHIGGLIASRKIGLAQKLDALAELTLPGPVVHLGLVIVAAALTAILRPPGSDWLLLALAASVVRPALYTVAGLTVQREPVRAVMAFAFLPLYLVWRLGAVVAALGQVGDKPWVRTARD